MNIAQQVAQDMITAMKAKDAEKVGALRMLNAALKNEAINQKVDAIDDETAQKIIKTEIKKRKDSIESYTQGGRADLAENEQKEIALFEIYLPAQMSAEEIEQKITAVLAGLSDDQKTNFGAVMGMVMKELGSSADGSVVREVLQKKLNS